MLPKPFLSIVIPAYNEANHLPKMLDQIVEFVRKQDYSSEIIVVENGSTDNTMAIVTEFARQYSFIQLISTTERGKGLALKTGMLRATGTYRFICDADLSMPLSELFKFLLKADKQPDVMIGTREARGSQRNGEPFTLHLLGRIANIITQLIVISGYSDTQCGFKIFKEQAAVDLFSTQQLNGISFDVELLFLAQKRGYSIREVPILWYYDPDSRISLLRDSLKMFLELFQIPRNWRSGIYSQPATLAAMPPHNQYV